MSDFTNIKYRWFVLFVAVLVEMPFPPRILGSIFPVYGMPIITSNLIYHSNFEKDGLKSSGHLVDGDILFCPCHY